MAARAGRAGAGGASGAGGAGASGASGAGAATGEPGEPAAGGATGTPGEPAAGGATGTPGEAATSGATGTPAAAGAPREPRLEQDGRVSRALVPVTGGVLGLETAETAYDPDDLEFFGILAGRVSLVLENARLVTDLRSTRARLDGILRALAEAVTVHDESGQTIYANAAAAKLLGRADPDDVTAAKPASSARASRSRARTALPSRSRTCPAGG